MSKILTYRPLNLARWIIWTLFALILLLAPQLFSQGASLSILSQIATIMIFGLSYNMLLGQGGMLSFGHAVYSGLGAFCAMHAMNLASDGVWPVPLVLIPLVGGVAGMGFGLLFGIVMTKKSGTTFSMITLGLVELVFACSLMFPGFFGGEGGVIGNRVYGKPFLGMNFGPQIQVYYLIALWLFVSTIAMYAFTQTPLGRILNAVRDNPERLEFIGYDAQWVRYLTLILSAFFAGIAGGLSAINFEIVTAENVSALRSGSVLLFTFIGGSGFFFGPMIGAIIGVFLTVVMSEWTHAWQLYLGAFFILIVMTAPGGVASLIMRNLRLIKYGKFSRVWPDLLAVSVLGLLCLTGLVIAVEMLYKLTLDSIVSTQMRLFGLNIDAAAPSGWFVAATILAVGGFGFVHARRAFAASWRLAEMEIEEQMRHES